MGSYGPTFQSTTGRLIMVSADGRPEWKSGGVTIDWSKVTAVSADTTLDDGIVVKAGDKYIRYGTIVDLVGTAEVQTIDLSGGADPTAGTWTITYTSTQFGAETTAAIAWNASANDVQAALLALDGLDPGDVVVTKSGFVYTLTFSPTLGNVTAVTTTGAGTTLTGADTVTVATGTAGVGTGLWAPADTSASDGRQTLARGESFILNETVVYSNPGSDHPAVFDGGKVFKSRLLLNETSNLNANSPTLANFLTAFPRIQLVA